MFAMFACSICIWQIPWLQIQLKVVMIVHHLVIASYLHHCLRLQAVREVFHPNHTYPTGPAN